jgi:hypothetical protein
MDVASYQCARRDRCRGRLQPAPQQPAPAETLDGGRLNIVGRDGRRAKRRRGLGHNGAQLAVLLFECVQTLGLLR